jgi:Uma2 family endonuclease
MATAPRLPYAFTAEDYLTFERTKCERYEWLDGVIYAMAGESEAHADICTNLTMLLASPLRGTPCRVRSKDTKVLSGPLQADTRQGLFSYPDLVVVCGTPRYHGAAQDALINPRVIIEVLSPSTQAFDRGEKRERYQAWLATLTDYVLVAQDTPRIEHWHKQPDGAWLVRTIEGLQAALTLESIGVQVTLSDVYERVFPVPEP